MTQEESLNNKGIEQPTNPSQWRMNFRKSRLGTRSQSVPKITTHRNTGRLHKRAAEDLRVRPEPLGETYTVITCLAPPSTCPGWNSANKIPR